DLAPSSFPTSRERAPPTTETLGSACRRNERREGPTEQGLVIPHSYSPDWVDFASVTRCRDASDPGWSEPLARGPRETDERNEATPARHRLRALCRALEGRAAPHRSPSGPDPALSALDRPICAQPGSRVVSGGGRPVGG